MIGPASRLPSAATPPTPPGNAPGKGEVTWASLIGKPVSAGWSSPTGTVSRATFDQSTVSTAQLAQRVAALIEDLLSKGLLTK